LNSVGPKLAQPERRVVAITAAVIVDFLIDLSFCCEPMGLSAQG
jgi:hypothetical protein